MRAPVRELITSVEVRTALVRALEELAPLDGTREIPAKVYANALLDLLAQLVFKYNKPPTQDEIDFLVAAFRGRLEGASKLAGERRVRVNH